MVTQATWGAATDELSKLVPGCNSFLPESISAMANECGHAVDFVRLLDWESLDDISILRRVVLPPVHASESLLIVTEVSYRDGVGPFLLRGNDLEHFVATHLGVFGECFFNGDAVIVRMTTGQIVLFHHEGYFACVSCSLVS